MDDKFEFRDFSMLQSAVGQRVNTDSCVFAELVGAEDFKPQKILDIGAGTYSYARPELARLRKRATVLPEMVLLSRCFV